MSHRLHRSVAAAAGLAALASTRAAQAQTDPAYQLEYGERVYGMVAYEVALPTGDAKDYVNSNTSWLGISFAGHKVLRPNMSLGFETGWNEFHDRSGGTTQINNGAVTGEQYRHLMQFPLLVAGRYYLGSGGLGSRFRPFAGVGLGTYYTRQLLDLGLNEYTSDAWQFGVAPEAGVLMINSGTSVVQFRVRYNYPVSSGDWLGGGSRSFNSFSFSIGAGFRR